MESQLSRLADVQSERVPAIDGLEIQPGQFDSVVDFEFAGSIGLSLAEVGCFLSHRMAWIRIAEGTDRYGVVMEDDVLISSKAADFLSDDVWIPCRTGLIRLETNRSKLRLLGRNNGGRVNDTKFELFEFRGGFGGGAYILHREMAKWLLQMVRRIERPVDTELFRPDLFRFGSPDCDGKARRLQIIPALAIQQVCLEYRFLPHDAETSTMGDSGFRKSTKVPLHRKFIRECIRMIDVDNLKRQLRFSGQRRLVPFLE